MAWPLARINFPRHDFDEESANHDIKNNRVAALLLISNAGPCSVINLAPLPDLIYSFLSEFKIYTTHHETFGKFY